MGYSSGCGGGLPSWWCWPRSRRPRLRSPPNGSPPAEPGRGTALVARAPRARPELAKRTGIPAPYWAVDPRTARPVRLGQPLDDPRAALPRRPAVPLAGVDDGAEVGLPARADHLARHAHRDAHLGAVPLPRRRSRASSACRSGSSRPRPLVVLDLRCPDPAPAARRLLRRISDLRRFEGGAWPHPARLLRGALHRPLALLPPREPAPTRARTTTTSTTCPASRAPPSTGSSSTAAHPRRRGRHLRPGRDVRPELRGDHRGDRAGRDHPREHGFGPRPDAGVRRLDRGERPPLPTTAAQRRSGRPGFSGAQMGMTGLHRLAVAPSACP